MFWGLVIKVVLSECESGSQSGNFQWVVWFAGEGGFGLGWVWDLGWPGFF